jgi:aldose 1-epimerase
MPTPTVTSRIFGHLPDGRPVHAWTLSTGGGLVAEVITYGGIVTRLLVPNRAGERTDVVLGFNQLPPYLERHPYFGAIIGRVAGRVRGARFSLGGREYRLAANNGPHHLHGGAVGFDRRLWSATPMVWADGAASLALRYRSPAGEEGYPGNVDVRVTYTVTPGNALVFEWEAQADAVTPLSLTHHSYFNLAGEGSGSVVDHVVQILADDYAPMDEHLGLIGRRKLEPGAGNDFRSPRRLGDALPRLVAGHGDFYFLPRRPEAAPATVARVVDPRSGRAMDVATTEDGLQFYTGESLDGRLVGKSGAPYGPNAGLCLECEGYPEGLNTPELGDIVLRPGVVRRHTTAYAFYHDNAASTTHR